MADTLGSLIDKLFTVDMKMWVNQEFLYEVRKISFDEFQEQYVETEEKQKELFESLKKCCDLNYQRSQLIDEIDQTMVGIANGDIAPEDLIQLKHKTY
jgi:hypothetical protein